eukprot:gene9871-35262_t
MAMKVVMIIAALLSGASTSAISPVDFPTEVQAMMAGLVGEGQSIEFALYQAIHWGEGGVGFNCGDIDYDTPTGGEAKCNAVDGCAWQSQGAVPRYFVGGQEQWYLEYAYFSANNGVAPAETDLQQYDLRYPFMRGDQTLDDVDDSAVQGCLQENYTQQLAQIDFDIDTYYLRQLVCLNISAAGRVSGTGFTSEMQAACDAVVGCTSQSQDDSGENSECNPDPKIWATCADPLHPRYDGGIACKSRATNQITNNSSWTSCPAAQEAVVAEVTKCGPIICATEWAALPNDQDMSALDFFYQMFVTMESGSVDIAIAAAGTEMAAALTCLKDSADMFSCTFPGLYGLESFDNQEAFWEASDCWPTSTAVPVSTLLLPGLSCAAESCYPIDVCSQCTSVPDGPTGGEGGEGDENGGDESPRRPSSENMQAAYDTCNALHCQDAINACIADTACDAALARGGDALAGSDLDACHHGMGKSEDGGENGGNKAMLQTDIAALLAQFAGVDSATAEALMLIIAAMDEDTVSAMINEAGDVVTSTFLDSAAVAEVLAKAGVDTDALLMSAVELFLETEGGDISETSGSFGLAASVAAVFAAGFAALL